MATSMSSGDDRLPMKEASQKAQPVSAGRRAGRFSRRTVVIICGIAALLLIGLAVGLSVGLTIGRGSNNGNANNGGSEEPSGPVPFPLPAPGNETYWQPGVNITWQIVLQDPIVITSDNTTTNPDVDIWDIDLFSNSNVTIEHLHNLGKKVICYFSAGSYEPYRPDSSDFQPADLGNALDGWPDEKWINISSPSVHKIMTERIKLAKSKGCDAADPDNVDGYNNDNGLNLTQADTISYMHFLSGVATSHNLSIGLKNAGEVLSDLTSVVHFSVNEQCVQYSECSSFAPMIAAGKPVFHIEYPKGAPNGISEKVATNICGDTGDASGSQWFSTVLKGMDLDGWVEYCDQTISNTAMVGS